MHLNKSSWRRAVRASVSVAAVLGMVGPVCADPVMSSGDAQPVADSGYVHEPLTPPETRSMALLAPSAVIASANEEVQWRRDFANSVLEIVRPADEALTSSGLLDALRSLGSELGLTNGQSLREISWGDPLRNTDHSARTRAVGWASPGDRAGEFHQQRSAAQTEDDRRNAALKLKELIDEIKLWAVLLVALYGLAYLVKVTLDYRHRKAARQRKRSAMSSRRRRHRQHRHRPMA